MNRDIKFRSWNKKLKCWGGGISINRFGVAAPNLQRKDVRNRGDTYVIMQYIGLKDKNGEEIYEGDIVKCTVREDVLHEYPDEHNLVTDIIWNDADKQFQTRAIDDSDILYSHGLAVTWGAYDAFEILGNIYENPEMI